MNFKKYIYIFLIGPILIFNQLFAQSTDNSVVAKLEIPREFRAAWVATVANINWPSTPGLSMEVQKKEAISLLDLLDSANYNAVIFQVRPQADALYKSNLEPWSYFLTGEQGVAPDDYYDPLEFWVEEAHKRSIELHAWINPYRAHHKNGYLVTDYSIVKKNPELVVKLKEGYWWFDPSIEEVQDHLYTVVMDIARRYDVDGIHFDDYFYPYPSYNEDEDFPDSVSWNIYLRDGGELSRNDWRRDNVNKSLERIYTNLKLMKPHVKFGLSPFGIWRPNHPKSIKGFDQYDKLFADAKLWLNKGWIDYWSPQLYWTINDIDQSFPVLLNWWKEQNYKNRHIWPGISINKGSDELENQIMITRGMLSENPGTIHWSIAPLVNDTNLSKCLINGPYKNEALVPSLPWLNIFPPEEPNIELIPSDDSIKVIVTHSKINQLRNWVLHTKYGDNWDYQILGIKQNILSLPISRLTKLSKKEFNNNLKLEALAISVVDKFGNESPLKFGEIIRK
jgi:uncharacterized lipoprotein YddW (UPF0748 family)